MFVCTCSIDSNCRLHLPDRLSSSVYTFSSTYVYNYFPLSSDYDFLDGGPGGNDGLDPDIELEMEAFIDEIEEHLLMQDFDPDLQHM